LKLPKQSDQGRTSVLVALDNQVIGLLAIADEIRPENCTKQFGN